MRFLILVSALMMPCSLSGAGEKIRHLFVEWHHGDSTIVLGELQGGKFRQKMSFSGHLQALTSADIGDWLGQSAGGDVLLYFHAMWGQQVFFQRKCLHAINDMLALQPDTVGRTVISFVWHAGGANYLLNWRNAYEKGAPLGRIIQWIDAFNAGKKSVLCHSMGSRFFEGVLSNIQPQGTRGPWFDLVLLFSSDLDADISDAGFKRIGASSRRIVVFMHRRDRLLLLSSWLHDKKRLGRSGPQDSAQEAVCLESLQTVDMSGHVWGIQNHTHLDKKWVKDSIRACLGI